MKKRKFLSLLLAFAMCLTLIPVAAVPVQAEDHNEKHCICGSTYCEFHAFKEWQAWTSNNSLPTVAGNYYLTQDVTLDGAWECKDVINLCLNGKTIQSKGTMYTISVNGMSALGSGNLTITDCKGNGQIRPSSLMSKDAIIYVFMGGKFTLWNGSITGYISGHNGGGVHNLGTFTMNGGSICNNYFITNGGGVYNEYTFIMNGGSISGNIATNGGGVYNLGYFTMNGGSITGNSVGESGGGVYNITNANNVGGKFTVSGNVNIRGNKKGTESDAPDNNVYLADDKAIIVNGSLPSTANIGIFGKGGTTLVSGTNGKTVVFGTTSTTGFTCDSADCQLIDAGSDGLMLVQKHIHSWDSVLSHNDTHHWHGCTTENCYITADSKKNGYAAHTYDKEVATDEYLKTAATCTAVAVYYKSCVCGAKSSTDTFESGEILGHTPAAAVEENRIDATCTEDGSYETVIYCSVCKQELSREVAPIEALGHNPVYIAAKAPTCTEAGWDSYVKCSRCEYMTKEVIPAKGHTYEALFPAREATCTNAGSEAYYQCGVCGSYFNENKVEKTLSELTILALGHSWSRYTVTTPATTESKGVETRTCQRSGCTEKQTRTIEKLSTQTYDVSGKVLNHNDTPAEGVNVSLILGDRQIANTQTISDDGSYTFKGIEAGVYNLIAEGEDRTRTITVEVTNGNVTVDDIKLPEGKTSSVIDIKSDDKKDKVEAVVGNLDALADAQNGGNDARVEIKLMLEKLKNDAISDSLQTQIPQNNTIGMSFDLGIQKTVTPNSGSSTVAPITFTENVLLETTINLPTELQGKPSYTVYRLHDDEVSGTQFQTLTTTPNTAGEFISISADRKNLTINAKYFSEYVIAYQTKNERSSSSKTAAYQSITCVQPENGEVLMSSTSAKSGETVTITLKPEDGYVADSVTVLDKNGKAIELTDKGNGVYTFTMPNGKVSVSAAFKKAADKGKDCADCSKDSVCPVEKFVDTENTAWYHDGVHYCLDNGLMVGTSDTTFSPNDNITKGQIVTVLWRLAGNPEATGKESFSDIKDSAWYFAAVRWAADEGIVRGYENKGFAPDDKVTREQLLTILYRYEQWSKGVDADASINAVTGDGANILSYADADVVSEYAIPAMKWGCSSGLMKGVELGGKTILDPKGTATRVQAACILQRFLTV